MKKYSIIYVFLGLILFSCKEWPDHPLPKNEITVQWKESSIVGRSLADLSFDIVHRLDLWGNIFEGQAFISYRIPNGDWMTEPLTYIKEEGFYSVKLTPLLPNTQYEYYVHTDIGSQNSVSYFKTEEFCDPIIRIDLEVNEQERELILIATVEDYGGYDYNECGFILLNLESNKQSVFNLYSIKDTGLAYNQYSYKLTRYDLDAGDAYKIIPYMKCYIPGGNHSSSFRGDFAVFTVPFNWENK